MLIEPKNGEKALPLSQLKPVPFVSLPRPYPSFLPYLIRTTITAVGLDLSTTETIQLPIGPGIAAGQQSSKHGLAIVRVTLE